MSIADNTPVALPRDRHLLRFAGQVLLWAALFAIAFALDRPVAQTLRQSGFALRFKGSVPAKILSFPGEFWCTLIIAAIALVHPWRWKAAGLILLAGIVSGINGLIKWIVGRTRPFKVIGHPTELLPFSLNPFAHGFRGLFHSTNQCFPSGHAALAFATAEMLAILWPKGRWIFYFLAALTGLERILENAHYTSDVVGAALLGIVGSRIVFWTCKQLFPARNEAPRLASQEISA